ncbi:MAG: heparinase II/III-family protein [Rhodospirillaceae bacterium]|nr:heparinase II/III-family protein [Rhodospirillaceae bacterium]
MPLAPETPSSKFSGLADTPPTQSIELSFAGETVTLEPGDEAGLFERSFRDVEQTLALHRFAWLPLLGNTHDPAWVAAIWRAWVKDYASPDDGWAWHPYTAAERAINILVFAQQNGLPGPLNETLCVLAAHGPAIAQRLEFFGDHHTSNHLANNGRGLFLLGLTLGLPKCAELGGKILVEEAKRIFAPSGILREGSSHYHALLAANYGQCADAAVEIERPEATALTAVARRTRSVTGNLTLPGGFALIGDISPDLPPQRVLAAQAVSQDRDAHALANDGWHRLDSGPWSGLWHVAPDGFSHMPGHGHQDCGGFELHFKNEPVFIDPGRGSYGESAKAALYRSGKVHNTLLIDDHDPYPANKPYYDDAFRRHIGGAPPRVEQEQDSIRLAHDGFKRLKNVGTVRRHWQFTDASMILNDETEGRGYYHISQIFVTPLEVAHTDQGLSLRGKKHIFRLITDGEISTETITRWTAYGSGEPVTAIRISRQAKLPWTGNLSLEVL